MILISSVPFISLAQWGGKKSKSNNTNYEFLVIKGLEIDFNKNNQEYEDASMPGDEVMEHKVKRLLNPKSKVMITFDFGGVQNKENTKILSQAGAIMSMAQAVNGCAEFGWRFVSSDVLKTDDYTMHYYYMVKAKK